MTSTQSSASAGPLGAGGAVRPTRQRRAVLAALDSLDGFRSAQEIHALVEGTGEHVGLSTVYRTLQALSDVGAVDTLRSEQGESVYRRCASDDHHHHLVCRRCGRTAEVAGHEVERWAQAVAEEHGFQEMSHLVEIHGTCGPCAADRGRRTVE